MKNFIHRLEDTSQVYVNPSTEGENIYIQVHMYLYMFKEVSVGGSMFSDGCEANGIRFHYVLSLIAFQNRCMRNISVMIIFNGSSQNVIEYITVYTNTPVHL